MMEAKSPSKRFPLDIITKLPQPIVEIILCLLPIKEAARTSILSRDWRYKWTTIPKLVFDCYIVPQRTSRETQTSELASARKNMDPRCKLFYAIHQVLLLRQGPIHEFSITMAADRDCFELDQIILHLSSNHALKKLSLLLYGEGFYKLPLCAFSLHQLTYLLLWHIDLDHQPIFSGFGNLKSLRLFNVKISTKALLHLLSNCPSLTKFDLSVDGAISNDCTINELFGRLPFIEHLDIYVFSIIPMFVLGSKRKVFPTSLIHLKCVCLREMWLANKGLRFLSALIKSSPNLEKLTLELDDDHDYDNDTIWSVILEEYSDVWLEHLIEFDIGDCRNPFEMEFVKFILARSPKLKKLRISYVAETVQEELTDLDSVTKELPTLLINLKCIDFKEVLLYGNWLRFLVALIKCSPNLKEIYLELEDCDDDDSHIWSSILEEYSDVSLEHLNELKIRDFRKSKHAMEFVKFILARSPQLEEVRLRSWDKTVHQESEMLISLLRSECVSSAEIYIL